MDIQRRSVVKPVLPIVLTALLTMGFAWPVWAQAAKQSLRPSVKGKQGMLASADPPEKWLCPGLVTNY